MSSIPFSPRPLPQTVVEAWRADTASPAELRRGYARFLRARQGSRRAPRVVGWLVAGLVVGLGVAQAATLTPWRWLGVMRGIDVQARRTASAAPAPVRRVASLPRSADPWPEPTSSAAEPAPAPASAPAVSASQAAVPSHSAVAASGVELPVAAERVKELWQHAASALRAGDFAQAEQALLDVERSAAGGERDAARLARAQLLSSHGRAAQASELLEDLAARAQSALVQRKARELLARPRADGAIERSASPSKGTTQ